MRSKALRKIAEKGALPRDYMRSPFETRPPTLRANLSRRRALLASLGALALRAHLQPSRPRLRGARHRSPRAIHTPRLKGETQVARRFGLLFAAFGAHLGDARRLVQNGRNLDRGFRSLFDYAHRRGTLAKPRFPAGAALLDEVSPYKTRAHPPRPAPRWDPNSRCGIPRSK